MLFEIRNYHYDPSQLEAYVRWAQEDANPFLKAQMDVVGFWVASGDAPEFWGADPTPSQHGTPNVTWIIRWDSIEQRTQGHKALFENQEWLEIWGRHPDPNGYLHSQITFAKEI